MEKTSSCLSSMAALLLVFVSFTITLSFLTSPLALSDTYIIHMNLSAMPKPYMDQHSWYLATLSSISTGTELETTAATTISNTSSNHIYTYSNVIHGFCASLSPSELTILKKSPGYLSSIRDMPVTVDTTHTSQFLGLNMVSGAWPVSSLGKDVIIGLVDTGIWPESTSFSDAGMTKVPDRWKGECMNGTFFNSSMCNKKLIGARFYNKGLISNKPHVNISMNSARDTSGHGTHTSSTAAGNYVKGASFFGYARGTARGMAPHAHVAMYKVLWDAGGYASDVLVAMDQAISDGVNVISLSFGADGVPLLEDPVAMASFAAMEKGIFVASSVGNDGPWFGTLHNGIPWILNVAAGTIDRDFNGIVILGNGVPIIGTSLYFGNSSVSELPLAFMNECDSVEKLKQVRNKIIVCRDKNDFVSIQVKNAVAAGVTGGIFISNSSNLESLIQTSFPATFLSLQEGQGVLSYIKGSTKPRGSMQFQKTIVGAKPTPKVAKYSSRGPSSSCPSILKPDLMAPGSLVLASWPQTTPVAQMGSKTLYGKFNILSGTSMACPHAAGVAALLMGAHPSWSPAAIRSAMMTTADPLDNTLEPIKDIGEHNTPASPLAMGAGHINPNKALDPGLIYDAAAQDYVRLLCGLNYTLKQIQVITRSSSYNCSSRSLDLNYPSFIAFLNASGTSSTTFVQNFQRTVTNVGDGKAHYIAKVAPMNGFKVKVVPEELIFKHKYEKRSYKLSLEGPSVMKELIVHGSLSWVDAAGKHVVKSPIVATRLIP